MTHVIFVDAKGQVRDVDAAESESVMATAVKNGVPGIIGECGGNCTCATCHVYVHDAYLPIVGEPGELENDMLDLATTDRRPNSRLSCQIRLSAQLEGLTVTIPSVQP